jgi:MOSC domain-containing protein YiiM
MQSITSALKQSLPYAGRVQEIWIRPEKHAEPLCVPQVAVTVNNGIDGDHYTSKNSRKRQVTLIQYEHLDVIAALANLQDLSASLLRRNIVVSGINLLALKDCIFTIGTTHLQMTGLCHPCSRMEKNLGPGGYNAMRGHGGINATVIKDGEINVGDSVSIIEFT